MNTETVTSTKTGAVLQVIAWPEDAEPEDMVGKLWVRNAAGQEFSIRERLTTPGGEFVPAVAVEETDEERYARQRNEGRKAADAHAAALEKAERSARYYDRKITRITRV